MSRILEDRPFLKLLRERRRIFAQRGEVERTIREWRKKGYPPRAVEMAMKMADKWLEKVLK